MTAEVAIMNKYAVALAADSAVTVKVQTETGERHKIYNTSNKLFTLSKYFPVGIMIYGDAELLGVPWEVIIKQYRIQLGQHSFNTIKEYALDFVSFLNSYFPESEQEKYFASYIHGFFYNRIFGTIDTRIKEYTEDEKIPHEQVEQIVETVISELYNQCLDEEVLPNIPDEHAQQIIEKYEDAIFEEIKQVFQELPLSENAKQNLFQIAGLLYSRDMFPEEVSGVVIAGYGIEEIFPAIFEITTDGVINDVLKYRVNCDLQIDYDVTARIIPFAQKDMIIAFLEGVNPSYGYLLDAYLFSVFDNYPKIIIDSINQLDDKEKQTLLDRFQKEGHEAFTQVHQELEKERQKRYISPIIEAVAFLPKDELAEMAESLVNLTSFKHRVSTDLETVGGPIDVAVISKGDGMVWIKRKHYFKPELNHPFFANYFREDKCEEEENEQKE